MGNLEIDLLKGFIGLKDVLLFTSRMMVVWGKSVTVPEFSIKCRERWVIMEPVYESFKGSHIGWNRIAIQQAHLADTPKNADHITIEGKHGVVKRALSSIDFVGPYTVKSIDSYRFTVFNPEVEGEVVEYEGCLVFNFDDGRRFTISSYQAPSGTLGFTMDQAEIDKLTSLSSRRTQIA